MIAEDGIASPAGDALRRRLHDRLVAWLAAGCLCGAVLAALAARAWAVELPSLRADRVTLAVVFASFLTAFAGWAGFAVFGRTLVARLGNEGLAAIALVSAMIFVVSYAARVLGSAFFAIFGPFAVYVSGIGDEGIPCLLTAVLIVLFPQPGTVTLSNLTQTFLVAVLTGSFGVVAILFATVTIVLFELILAATGLTTGRTLRLPRTRPGAGPVLHVALAIGIANAAALFVQFALYKVLYRQFFATWYVWSVVLIAGFLYGGCGAAVGTLIGYRMRRIAP